MHTTMQSNTAILAICLQQRTKGQGGVQVEVAQQGVAQEPVEDGRYERGHYQHCDAGIVQAPQPRLQQSSSFSQRQIATSTAQQRPWQHKPK